jgi:hypothetical protein
MKGLCDGMSERALEKRQWMKREGWCTGIGRCQWH